MAKHSGLWIRRRQFKSARGCGVFTLIKVVGRAGFEHRITETEKVEDVLESLGLKETSYVCIRNGSPVTRFDTIEPDDDVIFMEIFSGG